MPVTPAAKKAVRRDERRTTYNKRAKRTMKAAIKELENLVNAGDVSAAEEKLPDVYKSIDKAVKRNIIHRNNANRKKARMAKLVNQES